MPGIPEDNADPQHEWNELVAERAPLSSSPDAQTMTTDGRECWLNSADRRRASSRLRHDPVRCAQTDPRSTTFALRCSARSPDYYTVLNEHIALTRERRPTHSIDTQLLQVVSARVEK